MSRKSILIILGILVVALGVWVFVESNKSAPGSATGTSKGIFGSLFPFGSSTQTPQTGGTTTPSTGDTTTTTDTPSVADRLTAITQNPTAGFIVVVPPPPVPVKKGSAAAAPTTVPSTPVAPLPIVYPTVRYAESGTGYIYEADAKGQNTHKISATVIARTAQAYFGDNGASVVLRYIGTDNQTISTYLGHFLPGVDSLVAGTMSGDFLADNISDLVMAPDGKSFTFVLPTLNGSTIMTETTDGKTKKQILSSPFEEWLLDRTAAGTVITTKAAGTVPGYAYSIGSNGALVKVIGGVKGLTTKMSPDGKSVLYSVSSPNSIALHVLHLKDGTDSSTGLSTLPEKCVWTADSATIYCGVSSTLPSGQYPDAWYQGSIQFNDAIWQITASTGTTAQLSNGEGKNLDMTHLALDSKGQYLVFINKNDSSLWSFDLNPPVPVTTTVTSITTSN